MNSPAPALIILNPAAGSVDDADALEAGLAEEVDGSIQRTREAGDARRLAREAAAAGRLLVVAAGGDGTVREVVQGLVDASDGPDSAPVLAVLPLGTGNDLARCLEIPLEVNGALPIVTASPEAARTRPLDLMEVALDGRTVSAVNAVVVGNGGRLGQVLDPETKARWGPLSYLRSAGQVAFELEPLTMELGMDGASPRKIETLNVVIANGRYAGGGVPIAPGADPCDGRLEVVRIQPAPLPRLLTLLPAILREEDPDAEIYRQGPAASVVIRTAEGALPVSVDGEVAETRTLGVDILPGRLRVRVPGG